MLPGPSALRKGGIGAPDFESPQNKIVSPCSHHLSKYRRGFTYNLNFLSLLLTFTELQLASYNSQCLESQFTMHRLPPLLWFALLLYYL